MCVYVCVWVHGCVCVCVVKIGYTSVVIVCTWFIMLLFMVAAVDLQCLLDSHSDVALTPIVEGFVILKKNPDYEE